MVCVETNGSFQNHPNSFEIIITYSVTANLSISYFHHVLNPTYFDSGEINSENIEQNLSKFLLILQWFDEKLT